MKFCRRSSIVEIGNNIYTNLNEWFFWTFRWWWLKKSTQIYSKFTYKSQFLFIFIDGDLAIWWERISFAFHSFKSISIFYDFKLLFPFQLIYKKSINLCLLAASLSSTVRWLNVVWICSIQWMKMKHKMQSFINGINDVIAIFNYFTLLVNCIEWKLLSDEKKVKFVWFNNHSTIFWTA